MPGTAASPPAPILVVEDDPDLRESLCDVLRDEGYAATAAADGRSALDWLRKNPAPVLILLDLMMPVMSGDELGEELARDQRLRGVPVVVLSALEAGRQKGGVPTARAYLKKPIDPEELIATVSGFLAPAPRAG